MIEAKIKKDTYTEYLASQNEMYKFNLLDAKTNAILSLITEKYPKLGNINEEVKDLKTHLVSIKDDAIMEKYFKEKIDLFQKIYSKKTNWFEKFLLYFLTIIFLPTLFLTGLISLKNENYAEFKFRIKKFKENNPTKYKKYKWKVMRDKIRKKIYSAI
ncbi:hypothetical protein C2G38_2075676, partial [Gigaspora rosea]